MDQKHAYRVDVRGTSARTGTLESPDGLPLLGVAAPPQFGGPDHFWTPEHLFVASVASCLMTTFRSMAERSGLQVVDYSDSASGSLVEGEDRLYRMAEVTLRPHVVIADPGQADRTLRLLDNAERMCLIGRSINSVIRLEPRVSVVAQV